MADPMVESLRRLVEREGGAAAVADAIGVNDQSLYQILKGVRLPSGRPKGVGPSLRAKLSAVFPDWLSQPESAGAPSPLRLNEALEVVGIAIAALPAEHRQELADDLRQWALYGGRDKHRGAVAETLLRTGDVAHVSKRTGTG